MIAEIDVEYIMGHIRYGHYQFDIPEQKISKWNKYISLLQRKDYLTKEEDNEFDLLQDEFDEYKKIIVEDFRVEDVGPMIPASYRIIL
jgi:hypothetical protein